jgi:hypothetical protein
MDESRDFRKKWRKEDDARQINQMKDKKSIES